MALAVRAPGRQQREATAEVPAADPSRLGTALFRWARPTEGRVLAAFGEAERREGASLQRLLASLRDGTWFGAAMFDPLRTRGEEWAGFAPARFVLPALLYSERDGTATLTAHGPGAQRRLDEARRRLDEARGLDEARTRDEGLGREEGPARAERPLPRAHRIPAPAAKDRWDALISLALRHIRAGTLDKVVLARAIEVECDAGPEAALRALEARYPTCRSFALRTRGAVLVGATPETLCRVEHGAVMADALAGSAPPAEAEALLNRPKDLREHRWVVEHVASALARVCDSVEHPPAPGLKRLPNVAHLHTPVRGWLRPGRTVADVVEALHPTPAVGGTPANAALQFIRDHEGIDRGLYAGLVGIVSPEETELAVALRCALLRPGRARLFVGAGIVEGSSAEEEWEETELKARPLLEALGG